MDRFAMELHPTSSLSGKDYLDRLPLETRRAAGAVYTPRHIVRFTLEQAGYTPQAAIESTVLVDPACGAGAFLEEVVTILAERFGALGVDLESGAGRDTYLRAVREHVFGVDVDERACELARATVRQRILALLHGPLPAAFFDGNVLSADFLLAREVDRWASRLPRPLQLVVGNPPYVSATRLSNDMKRRLRARFSAAGGRLDLYAVFIERSLELVGEGGRVAFVTPDKFLVSRSAQGLRAHILAASAVRSVAQFKSHKIFDDAATVPCVTVLERGGRARPVDVLTCDDSPDPSGRVQVTDRVSVPHESLGAAPWYISAPRSDALATRLMSSHPTLAALTVRVSAGPATGRDPIFVLDSGELEKVEPSLLRSAVRGRDVQRFAIADAGLQILLPFEFDFAGTPSLIDLDSYPGARAYLRRHREELESRHCVRVWGKPWFDLHDQPASDLTKLDKLLVPDIANSNRFAVDRGRYFPLHSAYYLVPKPGVELEFLAAVLNSRAATFLLRHHSPVVKDGFQRYRQQFLFKLPVPTATAVERKAITRAVERGDFERAEELASALFRLSPGDQRALQELP